jgi:AcrR family transcriptional regulator
VSKVAAATATLVTMKVFPEPDAPLLALQGTSLRESTLQALPAVRTPDPEATRRDIIDVATREFAQHGLAGARVDEIAAKTACSKRMIYYYFDDKEGLYLAVLEEAYRRVRSIEAGLELHHLEPREALQALVGFTFDHHHSNEDFIRLVMIENIHHARYLQRSAVIQALNAAAIGTVDDLYQRGCRAGLFRPGLDAADLHWQISALCFFNVSNRATFSSIFDLDLSSDAALSRLRANVCDTMLRYVLRDPAK